MTFEKIRTKDGRVVILKNPREVDILGATCISGMRVDREGVLVEREGALQHEIIDTEAIGWRKPMVMSNHYGELVYL